MTPWNPPETAPKNKGIVVDVGIPWALVGHWDESEQKWVCAFFQAEWLTKNYGETK